MTKAIKKSMAALLAVLMLLAFASCAGNSAPVVTVTPEISKTPEPTPSATPDGNKEEITSPSENIGGEIYVDPVPTPDSDEPQPDEPISEKPMRENELQEQLKILLEGAESIYDIVYGAGLPIDLSAQCIENYWQHYPVTDSHFTSKEQLKELALSVYSEDYCQTMLFDDMCEQEYSRYVEYNGVLYGAELNGENPLRVSWDVSSAKISMEIGDRLYVSIDCYYSGDADALPGQLILLRSESGLRLDCDITTSNQPQEKRRADEITIEQARSQFFSLTREETGLEHEAEEYVPLFDSTVAEVSGERCYSMFLYLKQNGEYVYEDTLLLAMDGSGIRQRLRNENMFADYSAYVYFGYGDGCLAACEYIGYYEDDEQMQSAAEKYAEDYLLSVSEFVDCGGSEMYAIIPKYYGEKLTVRSLDMEGKAGDIIAASESEVLIIACNISDIMPNVLVSIEYEGQTVEFSPYISLKDGALVTHARVSCIPSRMVQLAGE